MGQEDGLRLKRQQSQPSHLQLKGKLVADVGDPHHAPKVIRYKSTRLAHWGVIDCRMVPCTLFNCYPLWIKLAAFVLLGSLVYGLATMMLDISKLDVSALITVTNVLNGLVAFLLGLYIGKCLDRWWLVVFDNLGNVWEQLTALCMLTGTCFPGETEWDVAVRRRLLRYSILTNRLVIRALRTNEETQYLQEEVREKDVECLCNVKFDGVYPKGPEALLLERHEMELLRQCKCRPQVVAAWIQGFVAQVQAEIRADKEAYDRLVPNWDGMMLDRAESIRCAIGCCERSLSTQLPFAYVHLITFVVLLNNLVLSISAGLFVASGLQNGALLASVSEMMYGITITFVYQSLLELCACLLNPLDPRGQAAIPVAYCTEKLEENLAYCMASACQARSDIATRGIKEELEHTLPQEAKDETLASLGKRACELWE